MGPPNMSAGLPPGCLEQAEGPADGGGAGDKIGVVGSVHTVLLDNFLEMSLLKGPES